MDNLATYYEILNRIHEKLLINGKRFDSVSPSAAAVDGIYDISQGIDWTDSFYVGMLWLDWNRTKDDRILHNIELQMWEFEQRLKQNRGLDNHDIGFLYILSAIAGYKLTNEDKYLHISERAAKLLSKRYHADAEFIQAWGNPNGRDNYRLIIDCMLNIPLIYWVADKTADNNLYNIAYNHALTTNKVIFRNDYSTYHTYYFDYDTAAPLYGKTKQGAGDDTTWSRGQAWAIYGFAISYTYTHDERFLESAKKAADYFIAHLPKDMVAFWDLCFTDGSNEPRDTSAAAIAACGMLELDKIIGDGKYKTTAEQIIMSLCKNYFSPENHESLLEHGTYSIPDNVGIDEACIWGDYYFAEALARLCDGENFVRFW